MGSFSVAEIAALERFCAQRGLLSGPLTQTPFGDGHSNLTVLLSDGTRRVVLRRPPAPPTPPGAHDVLREARVLSALRGSTVPIPELLAVAAAGELLDVDCYLMSYVPGAVITDELPATLAAPAECRRLGEAMVDVLLALHAVDPGAVGLADFGRPEGFNRRHISRMSRLIADRDGELPPDFIALTAALTGSAPIESAHTLLHNDFRIGNLLVAADAPARIAAVLDWELATLGDPLFDLGYLIACLPRPGEPLTPTQRLGSAQLAPGFPSGADLADRYARGSGRSVTGLGWYVALAHWKLAVLYEYSRRRGIDPYYADATLVPAFLTAAAEALAGRP